MNELYLSTMRTLFAGESLDRQGAEAVMGLCLDDGLAPARIAALLTALAAKGLAGSELTGFATAMRARMRSIQSESAVIVDTCGTGGSGLDTVNTSTLCGFIVAAAGLTVAKHGNRASSGRCGSTDVLERMGVNVDLTPEAAEDVLATENMVFMFAPRHHPSLGPVMPVRRALGFRTVFNFLGPLCNPGGATHQLLGVSDPTHAALLAETLRDLGTTRALVVSAEDGLDEISLCTTTQVWEVDNGGVEHYQLTPEAMKLKSVDFDEIAGGSADDNVRIFKALLSGEERGPRRTHLLLNAGAALYVAGQAQTIGRGVQQAALLIDSGAAMGRFESYRAASHRKRDAQ